MKDNNSAAQPDRGAAQSDLFNEVADVLAENNWRGDLVESLRALATATSRASQPVAPETAPDLLDALQKAARLLRAAGFAMTGTATSQIVAAIDAHAQQEAAPAGQWVRCTPDLIKAGVNCARTPRRDGDGTYSHDHFIAHAAPTTEPNHSERRAANAGEPSFDQIEDAFPEQGIHLRREDGALVVSAQWCHDFARAIWSLRDSATSAAGQEAANAKDAARFRWLNEDHDDADVREQARSFACRLGTSSYYAITRDIDAAMTAAPSSAAGKEGREPNVG